jgi:riboflavin kinase, archaea type
MNAIVRGMVQDGLGQGGSFTQFDWVRAQFRVKVGFDPYPGTLNVRVRDAGTLAEWQACPSIPIEPPPGFCAARGYRVEVNGQTLAAWLIPDVPGYPNDLMELMAPMSLRQALMLKTGDVISIKFLQ